MVEKLNGPLNNLRLNSDKLNKLYNQISSGKRITSAFDDPAGLAIAKNLEAEVSLASTGRRNISDAVSALQIADGAANQLTDIGGRLAELSAQASNGLLSDNQRAALNDEFQQLSQEAQRITATTEFNGIKLFEQDDLTIQAGTDGESSSQLSIQSASVGGLAKGLADLDLSNSNNARSALDSVSSFIDGVSKSRGSLGAVARRLDAASNNLAIGAENQAAAQARIEDFDLASGIAAKTALDIRQQVSASLSGQASRLNGQVALSLLS